MVERSTSITQAFSYNRSKTRAVQDLPLYSGGPEGSPHRLTPEEIKRQDELFAPLRKSREDFEKEYTEDERNFQRIFEQKLGQLDEEGQ